MDFFGSFKFFRDFWIFLNYFIFFWFFPDLFGCTSILWIKKDLNTEIEGLFTPKWGVRNLNPQKNSWIFLIFFGFFLFLFGVCARIFWVNNPSVLSISQWRPFPGAWNGPLDVDGTARNTSHVPATRSSRAQMSHGRLVVPSEPSVQRVAHHRVHRVRHQDAQDTRKL